METITMKVHFIAVGGPAMHSRAGNPELPAAQNMDLNVGFRSRIYP